MKYPRAGMSASSASRVLPTSVDIPAASTFLLFALALIFGGGTKQGLWSDALIEIVALPVLAINLMNLKIQELDRVARSGLLLALIVLLIPLIELVPLPPWLWHILPGRSDIAHELSLVGRDGGWEPMTLAPRECWMALLALIPPVTAFVATVQLDSNGKRVLVLIFLIWTVVGVGLTLLQMAGGPDSILRFYAETNLDRGVGFFANANHSALAMSLAVPFLILWPFAEGLERTRSVRIVLSGAILIAIVVAVTLTRSRAGMGLVFLAGALSALIPLVRLGRSGIRKRFLIGALCLAVVALFAAFQTGFIGLSGRFESSLADDLRWPLLQISFNAAFHYFPLGSGLGSFVPVYERFAPVALVHSAYVNHAHNDWLELFVEVSLLCPIAAMALLLWAGFAIHRTLRARAATLDEIASCTIAFALISVASAVDYPLRTVALMSVFAVVWGLLLPAPAVRLRKPIS